MKKRVAFRSFVILLAAVMLLSSTSAYNILVYANQDSVANSLSAIESSSDAAVTEPNIAVQGGSLVTNADEGSTEPTTVEWIGTGSEQNPYQISSIAHLMLVDRMVHETSVGGGAIINNAAEKHFILTEDINLTPLFASGNLPYIFDAGDGFLVSTKLRSNETSAQAEYIYINLSGAYYDDEGTLHKHRLYVDEGVTVDAPSYQNFALFGYLSSKSVISNVIFDNIDVNVTSLSPERISIIAYQNDGLIENCEIINSSITLAAKSTTNGAGTDSVRYGVAGAVADNRATISNVKVVNFTLESLSGSDNDYVGALAARNAGIIQNSSVSGLKLSLSDVNHYVGGLVGQNTAEVTGCSVDMAGSGSERMTNNITGGGYVGGLVGYNTSGATITNSSVTGTFTPAQSTTSSSYNIYGTASESNNTVAYFGGITGVNDGEIIKSTVADLGFYMDFVSVSYTGRFGGIAGISSEGVIMTSVASGTFVSQSNTSCYAGGIIATADADDTKIVQDCYALFKLNVPAADMVGAVVGYGGNKQTAVNTYWSDAISGCVTSYVVEPEESDEVERPIIIESFLGKLISNNRAVTVAKNDEKTVYASEVVHRFEKIYGASYDVADVSVTENIKLMGTGTNNTISTREYNTVFTFPMDASGNILIGADNKQGMTVAVNLDVFVTSASGDPDSQSDPLVISASSMAKFMMQAPYGHYKLTTDIAVLYNSWNIRYFTGSIDGANHMISTDTHLFKGVIGSRSSATEISNAVSLPERDRPENIASGVIKNLNIELSKDIETAVFGTVYNSTFNNVNLTDGDPTPDDGNDSSYEGYIANITKDHTAAFINYAIGNTYIYGCSTDVSVKMGKVVNSAAFIAYVGDSVVVDNCIVNSVGAYIGEQNDTSKAVFLGYTKDNRFGLILNSIVTARIIGTGSCYIVMGKNLTQYSETYKNITWSKMQYESNESDSDMISTEIKLWGSNNKKYTSIEHTEPAGTNAVYRIAIPQNVSALNSASLSDFDISLVTINEAEGYVETPYTDNAFTLSNATVENGEIILNVSFSSGAAEGKSAWVKVFHYDTGLLTYVRFTVIKEEFERGKDGYYHISSKADLLEFSRLTNSNPSYLGYAYKLDKDIDMEGAVFTPAAASEDAVFTGRFDGMGYKIENITISVDEESENINKTNLALIASAVSGEGVTVTSDETGLSETVDSGIFNLTIEDANVIGTSDSTNVAVLLANSSSASETEYGEIQIENVKIVNSSVVAQGKNTAAVLAYSSNTNVNIKNVELSNVSVRTGYTENATSIRYINNTSGTNVGGIAGVIGTVYDFIKQPTESRMVNVSAVTVNGLKLGGVLDGEDAYAMVNAGAVVGTYQKWYAQSGSNVPKLTIGKASAEAEYDVVVNDLLIMSTGITGGLIGSTNAQTTVSKAKISATNGNKSQILSKTQYFIGGIAGHVGSYDADNETDANAVVNMFGTISDCLVENTEIKAVDEAIQDPNTTLTRNVAVGGVVGAINGPATGETVKNCIVKNSLVEGVVVGGIVGSNIERTVAVGNILHIKYCDIQATTIKTLDDEKCYPMAYVTGIGVTNYAGVGGILGTNVSNNVTYSVDTVISYCNVDELTKIENYIPATYTKSDNSKVIAQSATGGVLGSGFQKRGDDNGQLVLEHNVVAAEISSSADMEITEAWDTIVKQSNTHKLRVGTGGMVGMLAGYHTAQTADTSVDLLKIHITDSVFAGSVYGSDCISGIIGSVVSAYGYANGVTNSVPTDLIKNVVVSGSLSSFRNNAYYRGGIAIGSILIHSGAPTTFPIITTSHIFCFSGNVQMTTAFSEIYFSSLTIDTNIFPVFSCVGTNASSTTYGVPTTSTVKDNLKNCYTDVNCKEDNTSVQLTNKTESVPFTISGDAAPMSSRGIFSLEPIAALNNKQSHWKSSNTMIAAVSENSVYTSVEVTPKSQSDNPIIISVDYLAVLTSDEDSSWIIPVSLPVGFKLYSTAVKALDWVVADNGKTYYLISDKDDLKYVETNKNYWLKNDLLYSPEDFAANGIYDGGYLSLNIKEDKPFNGEFASMPSGTHTVKKASGGETTYYTDTDIKTISGLEFALGTAKNEDGTTNYGTYSVAALFGYASGATFKNFVVSNITSSVSADYAATIAAVIKGTVVAENVVVENANISGAKYSGGLFGGMFDGTVTEDSPIAWQVTNCSLNGARTGSGDATVYSTNISGINGAAGIAVHTDKYPALFSNVKVSGSYISQSAATVDSANFDNGAAGISLAYSGTISANEEGRNTVVNSCIKGEIAAGAIMRTYTSGSASAFTSAGKDASVYSTKPLLISGVDIKFTHIEGTQTLLEAEANNQLFSSGGVLSRVDSSYVTHTINDCFLDKETTVMAPNGVGGIVGCFEETVSTTDTIINDRSFGVSINDCSVEATVKMLNGAEIEDTDYEYFFFNMGAGGIIGAFSSFSNLTKTNISNCEVTGVISGPSAVGGIIGAIWTNYPGTAPDSFRLDKMDTHFVENCIVSAEFKNSAGEDSFATSTPATGIVVGYTLSACANSNDSVFGAAASAGFKAENYPFYNIYYSGHKYIKQGAYLFGVLEPNAANSKSLNYLASSGSNAYSCFTDYIYDVDFYTAGPVEIDATGHNIILTEDYRVKQTASQEGGIWVLDNLTLGQGKEINLSDFSFNTNPIGGAESALTYRFDAAASLSGFTLSDSAATADSSVAVLEEVTTTSPLVKVEKINDGTYKISKTGSLTKTLMFDMVFVYSNGLELVAPFRIDVSDGDYFFAENNSGGKNYYVFNAANLNSTMQLALNQNDNVIQCFDVFWTLDNITVRDAVNDYTDKITLAEAFAGLTLQDGAETKTVLELLANTKHLNPEFDDTLDESATNPLYVSIRDYLGLEANESLGGVKLRRLVKEINIISFGTYGDKEASSVYERDFAGTYTVLKSVTENKSTGLTNAGEYYSVYGLELHAVNVSAQNPDPTHSGLFNSLASGAKVTGLTFVNPRIEVVGAKTEENYAGVLAGTVNGATITDVSVKRLNEGDSAYISSIRWMSPSSTKVGGIVGYADPVTAITNCSVDGLDIVGASIAGNNTDELKTVMAGGIAGASEAVISNASVANSRILIERNDKYRNFALSYAGGIAAYATGTLSDVTVSSTVMRDCTCYVNEKTLTSGYSVENNELWADRIGGVVAYTDGTLSISGASVSGLKAVAYDIVGGIIAEIVDGAQVVSVTNSSIDESDFRLYSSANLASITALRQYYNAAGGIIGKIGSLTSLNIEGCNFDGYVGTYSYDNLNKDCTAGGIIGFVTDKLTPLDAIRIYNSTVSGEVAGYRSAKIGNMIPYLGAAGGIIGKINTVAVKSSTENAMVSECVMGAEIILYNSVNGTAVNANPDDPTKDSTNVGKILGTLVDSVTVGEGEDAETTYSFARAESDETNGSFTKYFYNIYVSSYPQDILAYGSKDFYGKQISPYATYTDINKVINDQTGEATGALAVGGLDLSGITDPTYTNDEYSELAIIPIDTSNPDVVGTATRGFRVKHKSITFAQTNLISFEGTASIVAETDIGQAYAEVSTGTALADKGDGYYYGTLHIDQVRNDIIGDIVMDYSYGLQVNVQFISMNIEGNGSESTPFEISEPKHFAVVRALRDKHYIQTANIDFISQYSYSEDVLTPLWATLEGFEPIGTAKAPFVGSYNGQGNLISNLYISRGDTDNVGLFGYVRGEDGKQASLSNIHIELAGEMPLYLNENDFSQKTVVKGNVTGKNNVGGLVGYAANAVITNCSVVKGSVIGETAVGGLIGNTAADTLSSCFTSTTSYATYDLNSNTPGSKTAGGLIGTVSGSTSINNSFTLGYAALDPLATGYNYGAVGSFVGYVGSNNTLSIDNAFVGAGISDSGGLTSNNVTYRGITVGSADGSAAISASNVFISATSAEGENASSGVVSEILNPIVGTVSGATNLDNVKFDTGLNGSLPNRTELQAQSAEFSLEGISIGTQTNDAYTAAYVDFAGVEIEVSDVEITDRFSTSKSTSNTVEYQLGGLFYPVTVKGEGLSVTSSVVDDSDKSEYPAGMDIDLYGNGENKRTDLLFKNTEDGIKVYTNIYEFTKENKGYYTGEPYDNGEMFYQKSLPYFTVEKSVPAEKITYELYRKVTYPLQTKYDGPNRVYPIATERQLHALSYWEANEDNLNKTTFTSFNLASTYALTENITLGNYSDLTYNFKPINGFTGTLDGKGHTVSNIVISQPGVDKVGFFSELTGGTVKNLHLEVTSIEGEDYVGGLVGNIGASGSGLSTLTITDCSVSDYNGSGKVEGKDYVGGLAGYATAGGAVDNAPSAGIFDSNTSVTVEGTNVVGGLVGCSEMYISNCYSTGDVNASINATGDAPRGIGGLVGVLAASTVDGAYKKTNEAPLALLNSSFSSSAVDVGSVSGYNARGNGVGGLVGNVAIGTSIATVFSSGSVRFCYGDGIDIENMNLPNSVGTPALGVGGLIGVLNSNLENVYSAASVAANVGRLVTKADDEAGIGSIVGIGGLVGVSNATIQSAYSSGSTLGKSVTTENLDSYNYGVGGVVGLMSSETSGAKNLFFDINVSTVSGKVIGKNNSSAELINYGYKTTKEFTNLSNVTGVLGNGFGSTTGAYPYLLTFFEEGVSDVIRLNALLSIVAVEIDDRDTSALAGNGVSMAMKVPTYVEHDGKYYFYGFKAFESSEGSSNTDYAQSLVDLDSNTLSFQRTSNEMQQANFTVVIEKIGTKPADSDEFIYDGVDYSSVASRPFTRVTAEMLGTQDKPFLVASQTDLEHVAMSADELSQAQGLYAEWNTPLEKDDDGNLIPGKVYYRLMGYFNLNEESEYNRSFSTLAEGWVLDGNGYSIRNLTTTLANELDSDSLISNITFENVSFDSGDSLIGTLNGSAVGVNVYGTATGSNVAGIADTVGESVTDENGNVISGLIEGCISNLNYSSESAQSNIAGLALTNNGTINMSTAVGDISGNNLNGVSAFVLTNNGKIKNSFTMGDIVLDNPSGAVAGFVGTNSGSVEDCYTRCNIKVTNADAAQLTIGSFAGSNGSEENNTASISGSFAAGLFEVKDAQSAPAALSGIFVDSNNGKLEDVMFDKQLSGTCFKDIFTYAESTKDIATFANHPALATAYTVATTGEGENKKVKGDEYPQLTAILATANSEDEVTIRMYRALRSYSVLSTATASVANDNYIDNIPLMTGNANTVTPLTDNNKIKWGITGNASEAGAALEAKNVGAAVATASVDVEDFYNGGDLPAKLSDTLNLYFTIDDDGANPNFEGGNGTAAAPYKISTPEQVVALSYYGKNAQNNFIVINDINLSSAVWNAYINIFKAKLDGQGFVLSDISIPADGSNALIGSLDGGSISNLGLTGIKVTTSTTGASGLLAAKALNNASVTNCVVVGELNAPTGSNVGALFGETDGETVIDGCIVSGKIESGATNVGGLVGNAAAGTEITNCLSTALVEGGANTTATGGILGSGTATVTNTVVAGNVKGNTVGNIAGESENVTVTNSYYDKQLSTVDGGATASTTYFLTEGAQDSAFGNDMEWIDGFVGYPVPAVLASSTGAMLAAVKLASAKITFATGIGTGTSTTFTTATPQSVTYEDAEGNTLIAQLGSLGDASSYINVVNGSRWETDTSNMTLNQVNGGELTYSIGSMTRYVDVEVGKQIKKVNYKIEGLESNSKSIVSAITGNGGGATAATAFDTVQQGVLCNNMVFTYDIVNSKAQLFKVDTQLPDGYKVSDVSVECANTTYSSNGIEESVTTVIVAEDVEVVIGADGLAYVYIPVSDGNNELLFNTINITVKTVKTNPWGVRSLFGLFR